jgi:pilus assembly protein CpaF
MIPARLVDEVTVEVREALTAEQTGRAQRDARPLVGRDALETFCVAVLQDVLDRVTRDRVARGEGRLSGADENELIDRVLDSVVRHGPVERFLADETVEEIVASRWDLVFVYRSDGSCRQVTETLWSSNRDLEEWVRHLAATAGRTERRFDAGAPLLVMRLGAGLRLAATREVSGHVTFALRRNTMGRVDLDGLVGRGTMPGQIAGLLTACMRCDLMRLVFSGATGAGKTTCSRALLHGLDRLRRLVIIEDTAELDVFDPVSHPNVDSWEARDANIEGEGEITLGQLVKHALRFRPDLLVAGEVRDSDAAVPMIKAMTHGQSSLTTVHASSAANAVEKLALYLATGEDRLPAETAHLQLRQALDFVVHLDRLADGRRVVREVVEIAGYESGRCTLNTIYELDGDSGRSYQRLTQEHLARLRRVGFDERSLEGWWAA